MPEPVIAFAPGRVNLIGEHTDYNEGLALPFAISEGVTVRAEAIDGDRVEAVAADLGKRRRVRRSRSRRAARAGAAFVRGAVAELQRAGVAVAAARGSRSPGTCRAAPGCHRRPRSRSRSRSR